MNWDTDKVGKALAYLTITEMSTIRMQHGEPYVSIWVKGPRGGHVGMHRIDPAEAAKLAEALSEVAQ
jgi:hypothetical protein